MIAPLLITGSLAIWAVNSSTARFEAATDEQIEASLLIIELRDQLITAEWWAMQYTNEGQRSAKGRFLELVTQIDSNSKELLGMDSADERAIAQKVAAAWDVAGPVGLKAMGMRPGSSATARFYPLEEFHPAMEDGIGLLGDLNQTSLQDLRGDVHEINRRRDQLIAALSVVFVATILVAGFVARWLRNRIHSPLSQLEEAASRFGSHDFDHRIEIPKEDEFRRVAEAFNAMAERVSSTQKERQSLESQLRHQALHDSLTGLANRTLFSDRVDHAIARTGRSRCMVGVLFLDIDDFKSVNDTLGHEAGDDLLVSIGRRLEQCIRASDTAARLGGDEFGVLLDAMAGTEDADIIAARIIEAMSFPFMIGETELEVHASIGIATSEDPDVSGLELRRRADVAMYSAKARGKNNSVGYEPAMDNEVMGKAQLMAQLRRAVDRNELVALYQPVVELSTGRIVGAEALLRWDHPTEGRLTPDKFLPMAEESGFVYELDTWMLKEACSRAKAWQRDGLEEWSLGVNLSGRTLQRDGIVQTVARVLAETGLPAEHLVLEITESVLVHNTAARRLSELRELGVRVAIDDFGTGYSSLNYLKRFPIDILKIDKSFVDAVGEQSEGSDLTKAIVLLADTLHLRTVAEGIEREEQLGPLVGFGVSLGQGYLFAKPLEEQALHVLLEREILGQGPRELKLTSPTG